MKNIAASPQRASDDAWLTDARAPHSREDRVAEIVAVIALLFSLGIGLVIALLPVPAKAVDVRPVARPLLFTAVETAPPAAWPAPRQAQPALPHRAVAAGGQTASPDL
jgi:hypothetical protein